MCFSDERNDPPGKQHSQWHECWPGYHRNPKASERQRGPGELSGLAGLRVGFRSTGRYDQRTHFSRSKTKVSHTPGCVLTL
jgi:hypothetical protein